MITYAKKCSLARFQKREVLMEYWECWEYLRSVWGMSGKGWECLGSFESVFNIRYIFFVS